MCTVHIPNQDNGQLKLITAMWDFYVLRTSAYRIKFITDICYDGARSCVRNLLPKISPTRHACFTCLPMLYTASSCTSATDSALSRLASGISRKGPASRPLSLNSVATRRMPYAVNVQSRRLALRTGHIQPSGFAARHSLALHAYAH